MNANVREIQTDTGRIADGVFPTIDAAVSAATKAYHEFQEISLRQRVDTIETIREVLRDRAQELAQMTVEETGIGRVEHKILKNLLVINKTPGVECLQSSAYSADDGLVLLERASWGVIGGITPTTNPSETIINNGIGFLAAGNTGVFNAHPRAKGTSAYTVRLINEAAASVGSPENLLTCVANPTHESGGQLMHHDGISLLVVTGGPGVVNVALKSGKKVVCGGPGNPPTVVDETAKLEKAGVDIVEGHSFDNNIICTDEKEVIAVDSIADDLIDVMRGAGAYLINSSETERLTQIVLKDMGQSKPGRGGLSNPDFVGRDASYLLSQIGIKVDSDVPTILCEVPNDHPLVWTEQLMPILPVTRVPNVDAGIKLAVACEHGYQHTASMHSMNIEKLREMSVTFRGSIFVKNGPNYAGLGEGGSGITSFTIASPTGDGLTTAMTFSRERRCVVVDHFRVT